MDGINWRNLTSGLGKWRQHEIKWCAGAWSRPKTKPDLPGIAPHLSAAAEQVADQDGEERYSVGRKFQEYCIVVYAIVKAGGRQEKVAVGDIVVMDRQAAQVGDTITLPALLLVDGDTITTDKAKLAATKVTAEVLRDDEKGPKIVILKYKNKTGYRKRQGHRQKLTRVKITGIN